VKIYSIIYQSSVGIFVYKKSKKTKRFKDVSREIQKKNIKEFRNEYGVDI
jgi:hypothetical protein